MQVQKIQCRPFRYRFVLEYCATDRQDRHPANPLDRHRIFLYEGLAQFVLWQFQFGEDLNQYILLWLLRQFHQILNKLPRHPHTQDRERSSFHAGNN